jgi:hypothetical protein
MRIVGVRVDAEGLVVDDLPSDARLVFVSPSHQFPLGISMSLGRRMDLITWAEEHDAAILEDDYDTEFRFSGRPLEPLQLLDRTGRVIYVGTFSKTLLPILRVGFLVVPGRSATRPRRPSSWPTGIPPCRPNRRWPLSPRMEAWRAMSDACGRSTASVTTASRRFCKTTWGVSWRCYPRRRACTFPL